MTAHELKSEIKRLLKEVPEKILHDLLQYLQEAQKHGKDEVQWGLHLRKILREDRELLQRPTKYSMQLRY